MAIKKSQARQVRQPVLVGDVEATDTLSGSGQSETIELSSIAEKVTFQSSGSLAYNYSVSVNGIDFSTPAAGAANALVTYSASLCRVVKIDWVSGSGKVSLVAR